MRIVVPQYIVAAEHENGGVLTNVDSQEEFRLDAHQMTLWKALAAGGAIEATRALPLAPPAGGEHASASDGNDLLRRLVARGFLRIFRDRPDAPAHGAPLDTGFAARIGRRATALKEWFGWWLDARFDRKFGTDTTGRVAVKTMDLASPSARFAVYYEATPTRIFRHALKAAVPDPEGYVFIDYGSGKGRTLLLASDHPFKRVIGVELSGKLHITAQHNMRLYRDGRQRCGDVRSVCCDAAEFALPEDDLALYFYTPFGGTVFDRVLGRIRASLERCPRRLIIFTYSSRVDQIEQIAAQPFVTQRREIALRYEWTRVDQRRLLVFTNA